MLFWTCAVVFRLIRVVERQSVNNLYQRLQSTRLFLPFMNLPPLKPALFFLALRFERRNLFNFFFFPFFRSTVTETLKIKQRTKPTKNWKLNQNSSYARGKIRPPIKLSFANLSWEATQLTLLLFLLCQRICVLFNAYCNHILSTYGF